MSQVSLGDGVEMAKESTDTAPIEHQPAQSAGDIGHLEVMKLLRNDFPSGLKRRSMHRNDQHQCRLHHPTPARPAMQGAAAG